MYVGKIATVRGGPFSLGETDVEFKGVKYKPSSGEGLALQGPEFPFGCTE